MTNPEFENKQNPDDDNNESLLGLTSPKNTKQKM